MADDYEFGASYESTPAVEFDFDSFMAGIVNSLPPTEQQVAASLGGNDIETYFGSVSGGPTIGGVASGAAPDPKKEPSMISKFWGSLSADDKKVIDAISADSPQSTVLEQVANGVSVRMAVLYSLLSGERAADV